MSEPAIFPGLRGHEHVQRMLARAVQREKLHHGIILSGARGVGKNTLAIGLACALMCEQAPARGCGVCGICVRILRGHHPDVIRLRGEGKSHTILANSAREIALQSQHAPLERGGAHPAHMVIIDPADRMQAAAAAALLKSIEEPPKNVYFVLLATNPNDILDTLRSRCLTLALGGLEPGCVAQVVDAQIIARDLEIGADRLALALQLCDGSPGLALELASDASLDPARELLMRILEALEQGTQGIFSGDKSRLWTAWKTAVLSSDGADEADESDAEDTKETVVVVRGKKSAKKRGSKKKISSKKPTETPAKQRAAALRLTELWLIHLREIMRGGHGLVTTEGLRRPALQDIGAQMDTIQRFQSSLGRNPNVRLALEQTLLDLTIARS